MLLNKQDTNEVNMTGFETKGATVEVRITNIVPSSNIPHEREDPRLVIKNEEIATFDIRL
jgi:hypothetical protein